MSRHIVFTLFLPWCWISDPAGSCRFCSMHWSRLQPRVRQPGCYTSKSWCFAGKLQTDICWWGQSISGPDEDESGLWWWTWCWVLKWSSSFTSRGLKYPSIHFLNHISKSRAVAFSSQESGLTWGKEETQTGNNCSPCGRGWSRISS